MNHARTDSRKGDDTESSVLILFYYFFNVTRASQFGNNYAFNEIGRVKFSKTIIFKCMLFFLQAKTTKNRYTSHFCDCST